jgi:hypothetical protein
MTRPTYPVLCAALALAACAAPVSPPASTPAPAPAAIPLSASGLTAEQAAATITPQDVYARIEFLASDRMRGRNTPSPELEIAASYLVNQYKLWGLQPGGENGTFYQWWPFRGRGAAAGSAGVPVPNVVAVLPGSDPALRDEYVVLSAHMDHVGVGRPVNGDSIYNGADDDASGTTGLLEVAEAFARMGVRPRRSIVFLHVSGEEKGLLGSAWYAEHPTVPLAQTVANVNVDMIGRNDPGMVVVIGKNYSSLGALADRVGAAHPDLRLRLSDDLWPEERFFFRSDHFHFARKEVPAIFFFSGVHEDYHQPSDEVETIDTDKAARIARMVFYVVMEIANDPERPKWDPAGLAEVRRMRR